MWTGWETVYRIMITLFIGLVFFAIHSVGKKNLWKQQWRSSWWIFPYFVLMSVVSYFSSFGGGIDRIHFGVDFVAVAVVTIIIFFLALRAGENAGSWEEAGSSDNFF